MITEFDVDYTVAKLNNNMSSWIIFIKQKIIILLIASFLGGIIGISIAWLTDPEYKSEITFATESTDGKLGSYAGIAAQFGLDLGVSGGGAFEGENLMELFKSNSLIEKTLLSPMLSKKDKLFIEYFLEFKKFKLKSQDGRLYPLNFRSNNEVADRYRDSIIKVVVKKLKENSLQIEKKDKKVNLITVTFINNDEVFVKEFIEQLTKNVVNYFVAYKSTKSKQNVDVLQKQTDSVKSLLTGNLEAVASSSDLNLNPSKLIVKTPTQRKNIDLQVNTTLYTELQKNLELAKLSLRKEIPFIQIIDTPKYPLEKKKPGRLLTGFLYSFLFAFIAVLFFTVRFFKNKH